MPDALYRLYEEELSFIRKRTTEFATRYRDVAGRLLLEAGRSSDPHVERLIEAFAMVAARVRLRLDESYPELTNGLLEVLFPQALAPAPSMTIVQFELDQRQSQPDDGVPIARHTQLTTRKIGDVACRFRTTLDLRLFPLRVTALDWPRVAPGLAERDARAALRVEFEVSTGVPVAQLALSSIQLFLDEKDSAPGLAHTLYEALLCDVVAIEVRAGDRSLGFLPRSAVNPVGFAPQEAALETPRQAAAGYRLLQEYFLFEQKFLFVDITGLDLRRAGDAKRFQLVFGLRRARTDLERLATDNVRYGCTPAVNLFPMQAGPIRLDRRGHEHLITIDHREPLAYEVHSLLEVATAKQVFQPFWSAYHADGSRAELAYWLSSRRGSVRPNDDGTDVFVALVEPDLGPAELTRDDEILHVRALCSNRDLAAQLASPDAHATMEVQGIPQVQRVRRLRVPTPTVRPDLEGESRWRLVSHLTLNQLSLCYAEDSEAARDASLRALRDILRLYDTPRTAVSRQRIEGIVGMQSRRAVHILPDVGAVRGIEVELTFDETKFTGSGAFLFAAVLERFFAHHATINSFVALSAKSIQRAQEEFIKQWIPRPGARQTL